VADEIARVRQTGARYLFHDSADYPALLTELGSQMGAHRDWDELDKRHPIVSVSIGLPALFLWYGAKRQGKPIVTPVEDGDVVVWGGSARAGYHGVRKLPPGAHPAAGALRYNLTFRRAK
jgi:alkylated DNA repair protein (DNA oxidative demethylase)